MVASLAATTTGTAAAATSGSVQKSKVPEQYRLSLTLGQSMCSQAAEMVPGGGPLSKFFTQDILDIIALLAQPGFKDSVVRAVMHGFCDDNMGGISSLLASSLGNH